MYAIARKRTPDSLLRCASCETYARPHLVPWRQHAVGCPVRAADLQRYRTDGYTPVNAVARIAGEI